MRDQGRLTEWNDERGFGFVTPLTGGPKLFAHISEFPRPLRRPMVSDLVTYSVGHDERGRLQAHEIQFLAPAHARHEDEARPLSAFELAFPAVFVAALIGLAAAQRISPVVLVLYLLLSVVAFAMYWQDKNAALHDRWRISEDALLGVALIGGWPGAFLARHMFRHKTRKQPFRIYFWVAVGINCTLLVLVAGGMVPLPG